MNWSTIEREAYAVLSALKKFDYWIFGSQIQVVSDHNPLTFLTKGLPHGTKLARWALALQLYDLRLYTHLVIEDDACASVGEALMDRAATSRTIAQQIQSVTHYSVSARTIRGRLQQSGMSTKRPLLCLPLTGNHMHLRR
ncbi:hypothetical protein TNCV_2266621 [Trichonephila clavipes]|nr:hypothetical protein TNCV_2266621 [Trichonephila clavipes]